MFTHRTTTPSPSSVCPPSTVVWESPELALPKEKRQLDRSAQLVELTTRTAALRDRHTSPLLASSQEVLHAIKEQADHLIGVKETVDRLINGKHGGLWPYVERAGVLLKAAQEPRSEDPGACTQRLQRYLDEMMSLNKNMLSIAVEDLSSDGTQPDSPCPDEIVIPRNVAQFGHLIGKLEIRCVERSQRIKAQRLTRFHHRWRADLKKPDVLAELQEEFRALCAAIRIAEAPRLLGLPWLGFANRGQPVLTIASAPPQPVGRQARADVIEGRPV